MLQRWYIRKAGGQSQRLEARGRRPERLEAKGQGQKLLRTRWLAHCSGGYDISARRACCLAIAGVVGKLRAAGADEAVQRVRSEGGNDGGHDPQGPSRLATGNGLGTSVLRADRNSPKRRTLWSHCADAKGGGIGASQFVRGPCSAFASSIRQSRIHRSWIAIGTRNARRALSTAPLLFDHSAGSIRERSSSSR